MRRGFIHKTITTIISIFLIQTISINKIENYLKLFLIIIKTWKVQCCNG